MSNLITIVNDHKNMLTNKVVALISYFTSSALCSQSQRSLHCDIQKDYRVAEIEKQHSQSCACTRSHTYYDLCAAHIPFPFQPQIVFENICGDEVLIRHICSCQSHQHHHGSPLQLQHQLLQSFCASFARPFVPAHN